MILRDLTEIALLIRSSQSRMRKHEQDQVELDIRILKNVIRTVFKIVKKKIELKKNMRRRMNLSES